MNKKRDFEIEWSRAVNDKNNKPHKHPVYGNKIKGSLNGFHYVVYNIVRGLPIERGFIKGSKVLAIYVQQIAAYTKYGSYGILLHHFNNTIDYNDFKEKANEALRLYSNS